MKEAGGLGLVPAVLLDERSGSGWFSWTRCTSFFRILYLSLPYSDSDEGEWQSLVPLRSRSSYLMERAPSLLCLLGLQEVSLMPCYCS